MARIENDDARHHATTQALGRLGQELRKIGERDDFRDPIECNQLVCGKLLSRLLDSFRVALELSRAVVLTLGISGIVKSVVVVPIHFTTSVRANAAISLPRHQRCGRSRAPAEWRPSAGFLGWARYWPAIV
jgi:hypothetical protein